MLCGDGLLAHVRQVWGAVNTWKFKNSSGEWFRVIEAYDDTAETQQCMRFLHEEMLAALISYFHIPRIGRTRLTFDCCGNKKERSQHQKMMHKYRARVIASLSKLQKMVQDLKVKGLPGGAVLPLLHCCIAVLLYHCTAVPPHCCTTALLYH